MRNSILIQTLYCIALFFYGNYRLLGQNTPSDFSYSDAIENTVAANEDAPFDLDTEFENLDYFLRNPLDINRASVADFESLRLLSDAEIQKIVAHRQKYKHFISFYELQTCLDLTSIERVMPFLRLTDSLNIYQIPLKEWFKRGENQVFTRYERRRELAEGYKRADTEGGYLGDPNKVFLRYRYQFNTRLSYGVLLEKDAGEKWGAPDFYSFHFKISDIHKRIKTIVLGDFSANLGQGLVHFNAFNMGKSSMVLSIEKSTETLRAYTSSGETNFMRGVGITFIAAPKIEATFFASSRYRDANVLVNTTIDSFDNELIISSLQVTGLHRTALEIADKNALRINTFGINTKRILRGGHLGVNIVANFLSGTLTPRDEPYNVYAFRGSQLLNGSIDYKKSVRNLHFFGEIATSKSAQIGIGSVNGVLFSVDKKLSFSLLHRFFSLNYHTLAGGAFAESSRYNDENGIYWGMDWKPIKGLIVQAYTDIWQHKWLRYRVDAPSGGNEFFVRAGYAKRTWDFYVHFRQKTRAENAFNRPENAYVNRVVDKTKSSLRLHFQQKINSEWQFRNRVEWSWYDSGIEETRGFVVWQDIGYAPSKLPLKCSARLAFFDTNDYFSNIYAYENDLMYNFSVLPYYGRGVRFYLNASWQFHKNGTLEARWANMSFADRTEISSGLSEIQGNQRNDFKVQCIFKW